MPFPQPAVEQLSERAPRSPAWFGQLMMFTGTLFFIALIVYFGIILGYKPYLDHRVEALNKKIAEFAAQVPADQQAQIAGFYSQLVNLKTLLGNHVASSAFFAWLERATVPGVQIARANINTNNRQANVSGLARTIPDIATQLSVLQADPGVERIDFKNAVGTSGGWQFDMTITFASGFFTQPLQIQQVEAPPITPTTPAISTTP